MIARSISPRRRRPALAVLAGAALLALTGCGVLTPGTAAVVESATISHDKVDQVANALCSANIGSAEAQGAPAPELATAGARQAALQVLLETEISRQFAESEGVEPNSRIVSQALAQNEQNISFVPEDQKEDFRNALKEYAEAQVVLVEIGRAALEESGETEVDDQTALTEGQRLRSEFVNSLDIELDPRYGTFSEFTVQSGGRDLSVATSENAKAAISGEASSGWVSGLPASQKCG